MVSLATARSFVGSGAGPWGPGSRVLLQALLHDERHEVDAAAGVAPLVVVPRRGPSRSRRPSPSCRPRRAIEECGLPRKSIDTSGLVDVLEDALQRAVGGRLERRVHLFGRRLLLDAARRGRPPRRSASARASQMPSSLPFSSGMHLADAPSPRRSSSGSSTARPRARAAGPCAGSRAASGRSCRSGSWSSSPSRSRTAPAGPWPPAPGSSWCTTRWR